jgi:hypothetical protein
MGDDNGEGGTLWKAIISSTVLAAVLTLLGGVYTNARLEKQKTEFGKDLETFKVVLQNKNAQLEAARASYTNLDTRINEFEVALSRYVGAYTMASQNPGSKDLILTARQWYNDLSNRMGDVEDAVGAQGIDASVVAEVDKVLKPISLNLAAAQQSQQVNPSAVRQYNESWKRDIEGIKNKVREAKSKLAAP